MRNADSRMEEQTNSQNFLHSSLFNLHPAMPVCRLGLATRGGTQLHADDVQYALDRGVNFLNWCGVSDGLRDAIANLGSRRRDVIVCVQFEARTAREAESELRHLLN
jgi:hypothetical protein